MEDHENTEEQAAKSNSTHKIIIGVLAALLVGSFVYIYQINTEAETVKVELAQTTSEKDAVMKNLEELKATYDAAIAENTSMSEELVLEREKVVNLMNEVSKSKGDVSKYKSQYYGLEKKMKDLMVENEVLKTQNVVLTTQRDSTAVVLVESRKENEALVSQKEAFVKTIELGSQLTVLNMKATAFKVKGSGKEVETEKAGSVNLLKISFTIAANKIAQSGEKSYYVQVIDSKNNILGEVETVNFETKSLTYSFIANVDYANETVDVVKTLSGKEFAKGTYYVYIYEKSEVVSKTNFILK